MARRRTAPHALRQGRQTAAPPSYRHLGGVAAALVLTASCTPDPTATVALNPAAGMPGTTTAAPGESVESLLRVADHIKETELGMKEATT